MSRARPITIDGEKFWFDMLKNGEQASDEQLELLSTVEEVDLDDLLDERLTQGEIIERLRKALGQGTIPEDVLVRRQKWREARRHRPPCRKCGKHGDSTKHHFVNKWILKELSGYAQKWADRTKNCIPLCITCHRELHVRDTHEENVTIAPYLEESEKAFAEAALKTLADERPHLLILIARGSYSVYEARLCQDWINGKFA